MEWRDQGMLLSMRRHGESAAIIEVFTALHGRHAGIVPGGGGRRMAPVLQTGAQLDLHWRARLEEHIGTCRVEPLRQRAGQVIGDRVALAGLAAVCALLRFALPERASHPVLYAATIALADRLGGADWLAEYLRWELLLLEESGYGLDLAQCAVTGRAEDLAFVSPRSGRAVSRTGAGDWADRLLVLPPTLVRGDAMPAADLAAGFALTGHFLHHWLAPALGERPLPDARARLADAALRRLHPGVESVKVSR